MGNERALDVAAEGSSDVMDESERWSPPLVDADWCAFCQALYKGIEGEDWEEMLDSMR